MAQPKMTAEDKRWRAEQDARTLAEAKVIQQDKPRVRSAKTAAKAMATEKQKEASALKNVARTRQPTTARKRK